MGEGLFSFNGVDGETGEYLFADRTPKQVAMLGTLADPEKLADLKAVVEAKEDHLGLVFGFDAKSIESAGWAVVFPEVEEPGVFEALKPLLEHRKGLAKDRYRECRGADGYCKDEKKSAFLLKHKAAPSGAADPRKFPYYVLLAGSPEQIPFDFQYELDVQYGVGRIHFDSVDDYARYAEGVVAAETGQIERAKRVGFFGVANADDGSTQASSKYLVEPLKSSIEGTYRDRWQVASAIGAGATRSQLKSYLGGEETPAFLFTASHGIGGGMAFEKMKRVQGALLCQDWPGPRNYKGSLRDFYLAGEDVQDDANVAGMITMMFACYGAGTPQKNEFLPLDQAMARAANGKLPEPAEQIADQPFIAALPKRLLSHPKGAALAVVGHIERALTCSFQTLTVPDSSNIGPFESAVMKLMEGYPIGFAMEEFNSRYSELGNELRNESLRIELLPKPPNSLVTMVSDYYDARNYSVIGDPAVRLAVKPDQGKS